jgi:hypothetical protein
MYIGSNVAMNVTRARANAVSFQPHAAAWGQSLENAFSVHPAGPGPGNSPGGSEPGCAQARPNSSPELLGFLLG